MKDSQFNQPNQLVLLRVVVMDRIVDACSIYGTYDHNEWMHYIEERLTVPEYYTVVAFMEWVNKHHRTFGRANIGNVFAAFARQEPRLSSASEGIKYVATVFNEDGKLIETEKSEMTANNVEAFAKSVHSKLLDGCSIVVQLSLDVQIKFTQDGKVFHYKRIDSSKDSIAQSMGKKTVDDNGVAYCQFKHVPVIERVMKNDY